MKVGVFNGEFDLILYSPALSLIFKACASKASVDSHVYPLLSLLYRELMFWRRGEEKATLAAFSERLDIFSS
jgi:hypothetical protein